MLSCHHVFCFVCLQDLAKKVKPGDDLLCPQCRKRVEIPKGGLSALQSAFVMNSFIEIYEAIPKTALTSVCANCPDSKAEYFCPQCSNFLCEDCRVTHGKSPAYSQHVVSPLSGDRSSKFELLCDRHPPQPVTQYCQECKLLLCQECLNRSDQCSHTQCTLSITEAMHQCKDSILATLEPLRRQLGTVEGALERIRAKKEHIAKQAVDMKSHIDTNFGSLCKALEERRGKLKKEVEKEEEGKLASLHSQEEQVETARVQLFGYLEGINHCLQKVSRSQVISMQHAVEEKVKTITQEVQRLPLSPVEEADIDFSSSECVSATLQSFGTVFSSSMVTNCCVSGEGLHWATAGLETSITVTHVGASKQSDWHSHIDLRLSSEDSNMIAITQREVVELEKQVIVHYVPITKGKKTLHVTLFGKELPNSPFDLTVIAPLRFKGTFSHLVGNLRRPWGIAVTHNLRMVVVDNQGWDGLHLYEANGTKVRSFAPLAMVPGLILPNGQCSEPRGVAVTRNGSILLVDGKGHRIQHFSPEGLFQSVVGSSGKQPLHFKDPVGITVAPSGEVLVCDRKNHRIQVLTANLGYVRQIGQMGVSGENNSDLYLPWDVACTSEGHVYVADCGHYCVKVFTMEGEYVTKIGSEGTGREQFKHLSSICIDSNDYLYALDMESACVSVFNPRGDFMMQFGTPGQLQGQFNKPRGITVDREGRVYVSDGEKPTPLVDLVRSLGRVQVFQ